MDDYRLIELLKEHSKALSALLADPHPGAVTWWELVEHEWRVIAWMWENRGDTGRWPKDIEL